jgi:hypothetical protein
MMQDFSNLQIKNWVDADGLFASDQRVGVRTISAKVGKAFASAMCSAAVLARAAVPLPTPENAAVTAIFVQSSAASHQTADVVSDTDMPAQSFKTFLARLKDAPLIEETFQGPDPEPFF